MNEYNEIIATLDRILEMQERMIGRLDGMIEKINEMTSEIENISSEKLIDDAVRSMNEKWDTTGPR